MAGSARIKGGAPKQGRGRNSTQGASPGHGVGSSQGRPRITISAAMSVDGKISAARHAPVKLSSERDTVRVHKLRAKSDAIMVGINTVLSDDPMLTARHHRHHRHHRAAPRGPDANPVRVILDSRARIPLSSQIIRTSDRVRTIVAVSEAAPERAVSRLRRETSADIVVMGRRSVSLKRLFAYLSSAGIGSVLVEGGGTVNWELVRRRLFDEIVVAVSPYVLGGGCGATSLVGGRGFLRLCDSPRLRLRSARRLGDHVVLWYGAADDPQQA